MIEFSELCCLVLGNAEILYELRSSISKYSLVMRFDAPADFLCGDQLDLWGLTYNPKAPTKFSGLHELADGCSTYEVSHMSSVLS